MTKLLTITINDTQVEVEPGTTILQACTELHVEIPVFCYHERLAIAGNCRMCLVEVDKMPKPVASCAMPVSEGMVIRTNSPMVEKARKGVLEFLLINHPLDCPVCDQGGECDLQDITVNYGKGTSRFSMNKRAVPEKYMGPLIKTMMNRCIHCTRCVRFANEIAGVPEVVAIHRGEHTEITTLENAVSSELSGNMIDVCPVGALTSKPYAFKGRSWELKKTNTIDILDGVGASIRVDSKGFKIMRVLPRVNEAINEEWISDKIRFAYDGLMNQRLDTPYKRNQDNQLVPCSYEEAFSVLKEKISTVQRDEIAALGGKLSDIESLYALRLFMEALESPHMDIRPFGILYSSKHRTHYLFNTTIEGIEKADCIVLIGTNPRWEAPLLNARIRKTYLLSRPSIFNIGDKTLDLTYPYTQIGETLHDLEIALKDEDSSIVKGLKSASYPLIILGEGCFHKDMIDAMQELTHRLIEGFPKLTQNTAALSENSLEEVKRWIGYNVLIPHTGTINGLEVGFVPKINQHTGKEGYATHQIIEGCQREEIKILFSLGMDDIEDVEALQKAFVIYMGHHGDKVAHYADIILPVAAFTEKKATYVNLEGRAQQTTAAIAPPGVAKEEVEMISLLAKYLEISLPFSSLTELRALLAKERPWLFKINQLPQESFEAFPELKVSKTHKSLPFNYAISNFYMTCPITRHSQNMANCVLEILTKKELKAS